MRAQRVVLTLTAVNLFLLLYNLGRPSPLPVQSAMATMPTVRARMWELVDDRGQVRSSLRIEPDGEVVLRLIDKNGTIRIKLGAGIDGSGLVLLDETTAPGVHLLARRRGTTARPATTNITLEGVGGRRVITPQP